MNADTRRVLQDARRYLVEVGWCPWPSSPTDGRPACLGLAISDFASFELRPGLRDECRHALGFATPSTCFAWNDAQPSVEPVIALLDKVLAESGRGMVSEENSGQAGSCRHETPRPELQVVA